MSSHIRQIAEIVDRLIVKTEEGKVPWKKSSELGYFQVRIDDFLVNVGGLKSAHALSSALSGVTGDIFFKISNLQGEVIHQINNGPMRASVFQQEPVPPLLISKIRRLYDLASDESDDLSRLLKAIN